MEIDRNTSEMPRDKIARSFLFTILFPIVIAFSICHSLPLILERMGNDDWKTFDFFGKKLAQFAKQKDEFDMIFLGASQTYSGINPEVFDQTLAELGKENRSFNFGAPAEAVAETFLHAKAILDLKPKRLKWVILDINSGFAETHFRRRGAIWHTLEETAFFSRHILASEDSLRDRLTLVGIQWFEFFKQHTNPGRASDWLNYEIRLSLGAFGSDPNEFSNKRIETEPRGYRPLNWETDEKSKIVGEQFLQQSSHYLDKLRMIGREPRGKKFSSYKLAMYQRIKELLEKSNLNLVLFVPPFYRPPYRNMEYYCLNGMFPMIDLRSPEKYPKLYAVEHRFDVEHVNDAGATIQSQTLAKEFASQIKTLELRELASKTDPCDEKTSYLETEIF